LPEWAETSAPLVPSLKFSLAPGFDVHQALAASHWLGEAVPSRADK